MSLIKNLLNKFKKKKYKPVVLCKDLAEHMLETRTIIVPNYNEKILKILIFQCFINNKRAPTKRML